jgi:hypothetical protein
MKYSEKLYLIAYGGQILSQHSTFEILPPLQCWYYYIKWQEIVLQTCKLKMSTLVNGGASYRVKRGNIFNDQNIHNHMLPYCDLNSSIEYFKREKHLIAQRWHFEFDIYDFNVTKHQWVFCNICYGWLMVQTLQPVCKKGWVFWFCTCTVLKK